MTKDPEIELVRLRDRRWELDNELFETETKLNKAIKSISDRRSGHDRRTPADR